MLFSLTEVKTKLTHLKENKKIQYIFGNFCLLCFSIFITLYVDKSDVTYLNLHSNEYIVGFFINYFLTVLVICCIPLIILFIYMNTYGDVRVSEKKTEKQSFISRYNIPKDEILSVIILIGTPIVYKLLL